MAGFAPLIAQTALEAGVVALAGWELWKLRTPKAKPPPAAPDRREPRPPPHAAQEPP